MLPNNVGHERAVGIEIVEDTRSTQQQGLRDALLHVAVTALDGAVLVRDAAVVAGWHHAEVGHEGLETPGEVIRVRLGEVAEGRRKAIAAVFPRHAAEQAQGILQAAGQGWVAFAAEDDLGMFKAGTRECKVVEAMFERPVADHNTEIVDVGEVGQPHAAGLLDLRKDDVLVATVQGFPDRNSAFERASE